MSTSHMYHALGIRGYAYRRTDDQNRQVLYTIQQDPRTCCCLACRSDRVPLRGRIERCFPSLPIGSRATFVVLPIPRVECQECGLVRQVKVPFADSRRTATPRLRRYALEQSHRMTIRDVAKHLGEGWDVIKDIQMRDLSRRYAKPKLKHLRHIAIDEISIAKLKEALALIQSLAVPYWLKEDLRQFWEQPGKAFATVYLDGWIKRAEASGIKMLQQMATHRSGLIAYHDAMITSGPTEGTTNKIKSMKRQAYWFRGKEFFKLKILVSHETKYELVQ